MINTTAFVFEKAQAPKRILNTQEAKQRVQKQNEGC